MLRYGINVSLSWHVHFNPRLWRGTRENLSKYRFNRYLKLDDVAFLLQKAVFTRHGNICVWSIKKTSKNLVMTYTWLNMIKSYPTVTGRPSPFRKCSPRGTNSCRNRPRSPCGYEEWLCSVFAGRSVDPSRAASSGDDTKKPRGERRKIMQNLDTKWEVIKERQ